LADWRADALTPSRHAAREFRNRRAARDAGRLHPAAAHDIRCVTKVTLPRQVHPPR